MTLHAWRIVKAKYASSAMSGEGARKYGGRWSPPGAAVIYAAGSASLAMLEILVHVQREELLRRYVLFELTFDESLVSTVQLKALPRAWQKSPAPHALREIGRAWLNETETAILRVPSVVVPSEWNYLLNPAHPDFGSVKVSPKPPAKFDPRLIRPA